VQAQVINLLEDLREKYNLSYLFISHDLSVVSHIADRVAVMNHGKIVEHGPTRDIIDNPQDPYTKELIAAVPVPGGVPK
jgi:ABC-type oligopeptide transport system ATPase subunit